MYSNYRCVFMSSTLQPIIAFEGNLQKLCLQWHPVFSIHDVRFSEIIAKSVFNSLASFLLTYSVFCQETPVSIPNKRWGVWDAYISGMQVIQCQCVFFKQGFDLCVVLSCVRLFVTLWTVAYQAPLSMGFSRQEYWSGLPFPSPGYPPNPGIEPRSPTLQADALYCQLNHILIMACNYNLLFFPSY